MIRRLGTAPDTLSEVGKTKQSTTSQIVILGVHLPGDTAVPRKGFSYAKPDASCTLLKFAG